MTRTVFQSSGDTDSDIAYLNLNRLLARLEQNLLSPFADLKLLQESRYHRARVGAVCYFADLCCLMLHNLANMLSGAHRT
jgi:hypothetical protein